MNTEVNKKIKYVFEYVIKNSKWLPKDNFIFTENLLSWKVGSDDYVIYIDQALEHKAEQTEPGYVILNVNLKINDQQIKSLYSSISLNPNNKICEVEIIQLINYLADSGSRLRAELLNV